MSDRFWYDFEDPEGHKMVDFKEDKKYPLETVGDFQAIEDLLNGLDKDLEIQKKRYSELQSKFDKHPKELKVLVETDNAVLLDKKQFEDYVHRHEHLKKLNKKRKRKNKKYRDELKKRLKEISGLKEFIQEDLCSEDKVLKGFIEEYL